MVSNKNISFGNLATSTEWLTRAAAANDKTLVKGFEKIMPAPVRALNCVHKCTGEVGTNLVNAVGTGVVAPVFIAYNPLSNTDKDTRTYSAWRQPISAVLAVLMQIAVVLPFDKMLQRASDTGSLSHQVNRTLIHEEKFLIKEYRKANPKASLEELKKMANQHQIEEYARAMQTISDKGILSWNGKSMDFESYKKLLQSTNDGMLSEINAELKFYTETKPEIHVNRMKFYHDNKTEVEALFEKMSKNITSSTSDKASHTYIKQLLADSKKQKANPEIIGMIEEIFYAQNTPIKQKRLERLISRFKDAQTLQNDAQIKDYVLKGLKERIESMKGDKTILEDVSKQISNMTESNKNTVMKEIIGKTKPLLTKGKDFLFEVVQKEVKNIGNRFKSCKDVSGLGVGLATLPITCYVLNWSYPRIMDKFFPNLSKAKVESKKKSEVKNVA